MGRTPVTRDFVWYGNYDVTLRADGYQTLKTTQLVKAPIYQIVPIDLFVELLPFKFHDEKTFTFTMKPLPPTNVSELAQRARELKTELEKTRIPATQPATKPVSQVPTSSPPLPTPSR